MSAADFTPEFRAHDVTVRVMSPRVDWMARLLDKKPGPRCTECAEPLPDDHIVLNTESQNPTSSTEDHYCSWRCVLVSAAAVVLCEDGTHEAVTITEIPDWRAGLPRTEER